MQNAPSAQCAMPGGSQRGPPARIILIPNESACLVRSQLWRAWTAAACTWRPMHLARPGWPAGSLVARLLRPGHSSSVTGSVACDEGMLPRIADAVAAMAHDVPRRDSRVSGPGGRRSPARRLEGKGLIGLLACPGMAVAVIVVAMTLAVSGGSAGCAGLPSGRPSGDLPRVRPTGWQRVRRRTGSHNRRHVAWLRPSVSVAYHGVNR